MWNGYPRLDSLRRIDVRGSTKLIVLPDLATAVNLEELIVEGCSSLIRTPGPITSIYLRKLNMIHCDRLRSILNVAVRQESNPNRWGIHQIILIFLDTMVTLSSLTDLSIQGQISIELLGLNGRAEHLSYSHVQIPHEDIPLASESYALESLDIKWFNYSMGRDSFSCRSFSKLPYLTELKLINLNIQEIPVDIDHLQLLKTLDLSGNDFTNLPTTMGQLAKLKYLSLRSCRNLEALPQLTQVETLILSHCRNLHTLLETRGVRPTYRLLELCLDSCKRIRLLSDQLSHFNNLAYLDLSSHEFDTIPESIKDFINLTTLCLNKCNNLMVLEGLPHSLEYLYAHDCESLWSFSVSSIHSIKHLDLSHCFNLFYHKDLINQVLYDKYSQGVTAALVCVPEIGGNIYSHHQAHKTYRRINPPFPNNHKLLGFAIIFQIVSRNHYHLQFPAFTFSWQWTSHLLRSPNRELMINLKPNLYFPSETEMEKASNWSHVVIIHIPNSINDEYHRSVKFKASLQLPEEFNVPLPRLEILSCKARKIFENCDWEQPSENVKCIWERKEEQPSEFI